MALFSARSITSRINAPRLRVASLAETEFYPFPSSTSPATKPRHNGERRKSKANTLADDDHFTTQDAPPELSR